MRLFKRVGMELSPASLIRLENSGSFTRSLIASVAISKFGKQVTLEAFFTAESMMLESGSSASINAAM